MKYFLVILFAFLGATESFGQRVKTSFNEDWQFSKNENYPADPLRWEKISVPHTWNLDAYTTKDYFRGTCWYRKYFNLKTSGSKDYYIRFEAVNSYAEIFLNGVLLSTHSGGYSAFNVKLPNDILKNGSNEIRVKVDNRNDDIPPLSGDFTIFGGIYRDVSLIEVEKEHFDLENYGSMGVFVTPHDVTEKNAEVTVSGKVENPSSKILKLNLLISQAGKKILEKTVPLNSKEFNLKNILIKDPKLWSPENPNLYTAKIQLMDHDKIVDAIDLKFGLRWLTANTKEGFLLNGKPIKLMGTNRHQDKSPYGIAVPNSVHWEDMKLIKEMGANFVRLAHYQQDDEVLKACDSLGLLVWEEISVVDIISPTEKFRKNSETALVEMIRQHYNHPSIIMWGYMNEAIIQAQYRVKKEDQPKIYKQTVELAQHLEKKLKKEDKSRLSVMAFHGSTLYNEIGLSNITDIAGWNLYQGWYGDNLSDFEKFVDDQHQKYPGKPIIISEFGAASDRRLHSLQPETFDFTIEYQQKYLEHYLPKIMERNYVIGATEWNFIDFNVATRQESMPRVNNKGLVYNDRTPKDIFYYFKSFLNNDESVVHIATRDWKNRTAVTDQSNSVFPLKVYSNLQRLCLKVNGVDLEEKTPHNYNAIWNITLKKGSNEIQAYGVRNGSVIKDSAVIHLATILKTGKFLKKHEFIAINVGSNADYITNKNETWVADQAYEVGSWGFVEGEIFRKSPGRIGTTAEIFGTVETPLFQTKRDKIKQYIFDVPNGNYIVELLFADLNNSTPKQVYDLGNEKVIQKLGNQFDVLINGKLVLKDFFPERISGNNTAVIRQFDTKNKSNKIVVSFESAQNSAFLNGIKLTRKD